MWHLGSYKHFGRNGLGLHRVGTILSVASMQKSVRLPKVVAVLATIKAGGFFRFDKIVTGKIWWKCLIAPAQAMTKNRVCSAWHWIDAGFLSAHMGLCLLKIPSFVKDASSENNTLARKRGSVAYFSSYYCAIKYEVHNHPVAVSGHAVRETNACLWGTT